MTARRQAALSGEGLWSQLDAQLLMSNEVIAQWMLRCWQPIHEWYAQEQQTVCWQHLPPVLALQVADLAGCCSWSILGNGDISLAQKARGSRAYMEHVSLCKVFGACLITSTSDLLGLCSQASQSPHKTDRTQLDKQDLAV